VSVSGNDKLALIAFFVAGIGTAYLGYRLLKDKYNGLVSWITGRKTTQIAVTENTPENLDNGQQMEPLTQNHLVQNSAPAGKIVQAPTPEELDKGIIPNSRMSSREVLKNGIRHMDIHFLPDYWRDWMSKGHHYIETLWWFFLISALMDDEVPHVLIVGRTRSGKTLLTMAMAAELSRLGRVIILDPHASPHWGMPAVGTGRNYPALSKAMKIIVREMNIRFKQWSGLDPAYPKGRKTHEFEQLYIIMDETPAMNTNLKEDLQTFMRTIVRESAKVGIHLILLSQSKRVKTLGVEGEGDIRDSFYTILLQDAAVEELPEHFKTSPDPRPIVVSWDGKTYPVKRRFVPWLAQQTVKAEAVWEIPNLPPPPEISDLDEEDENGFDEDDWIDEEERRAFDKKRGPAAKTVAVQKQQKVTEPQPPATASYEKEALKVMRMVMEDNQISAYKVAQELWGKDKCRGFYHRKATELLDLAKTELGLPVLEEQLP
jgi:hypothetical protein